jgi:predicted O-linked N-acetylglucosamine transferase (SPINDLY family)
MKIEHAKQLIHEVLDSPQALQQYEQAFQEQPDSPILCAYLGLAHLLNGYEAEAQLVWFNGLMEISESSLEQWVKKLTSTLLDEAINQKTAQNLQNSWLIHQHIRELAPGYIENLLNLLQITIQLEEFHTNLLSDWGVIEALNGTNHQLDSALVEATLQSVLTFPSVDSVKFAEACLPFFKSASDWANVVVQSAKEIAFKRKLSNFAALLTELCLKHVPDYWDALSYISWFYIDGEQYGKAVQASYYYYNHCKNSSLEIKLYSHSLLLKSLLIAGQWQDILSFKECHKDLLKELFQDQSNALTIPTLQNLLVTTGQLAYLQDNLPENRWFQNQAAELAIRNIYTTQPEGLKSDVLYKKDKNHRLRVGYIASTLRQHSVGWLIRWLFQLHDRSAFEISLYLVSQRPEDTFFADWFAPYVDHYTFLESDIALAAQTIRNDKIDILIDLDSVTSDITPMVLALKPAPIQVTWLGYDASGLPTIDYFIADPYVLSDNSEQFYQEKIWRLPKTYVAVNGFEVGVPTLQRSDLNIPQDAVVYFSSQGGSKRHPETLKLQLEIIKNVPNSIFVLKGLADQSIIQEFVISIAETVGVSIDRLRFLDWMPNEPIHRANLQQIADIVLDTYPYNGATTTLETLWLGIPLVTRVGSTFSSRNSYAFLTNVGVTEGIAWTDQEYIEWGIKLGQDEKLRQQVSWTIQQSRKNSPLWNTKKFTHEIENAYREMWEIYVTDQRVDYCNDSSFLN